MAKRDFCHIVCNKGRDMEDNKIKKFETKVQLIKYKVLREVARHAFKGDLLDKITDIPKIIVPGKESTMRCCVYKERAIIGERVKLAMGGDKNNPNSIEVIDIACDECPVSGYEVTSNCRGCLAHKCEEVCKKGAITFDEQHKAHIDKSKCVECGMCAKVCPYFAIQNHKRPCQTACKVNAVSMDENQAALINNDKCISCGACVRQCPFGAISDKSFILDVINLIKDSKNNKCNLYAVVAPSIASQFTYAKLGQVVTGIQMLGFSQVVEAALGADIVAMDEAKELEEKGFLTSSCCPSFVAYIEKHFPQLKEKISHNPSPAAAISKYIKSQDKNAKVVFIGPCTSKKMEFQKESVRPYIDSVITFEELQALLDSRDIDITTLPETSLDNASYYGRIFAHSGGLTEAVGQAFKEMNSSFEVKPVICDGIEACRMALLKLNKNVLDANFIEGMACLGGCVGGAGNLTHSEKNRLEVDKHGKEVIEKTIKGSVEDSSKIIK